MTIFLIKNLHSGQIVNAFARYDRAVEYSEGLNSSLYGAYFIEPLNVDESTIDYEAYKCHTDRR